MPDINQVQNLLSSGGQGMQIPPDVRQRMLAAQLAQQQAAAPTVPYTSRAAGLVKALQGGLGGLMEGVTTQNEMQAQADHRASVARMLMSSSPGAMGTASGQPAAPTGPTTSSTAIAPRSAAGGAGSDYVASKGHTDFISSIMPEAQRISAQTGVDARLIAAQAAVESNFGKSAPGGNLFGIKGPGTGPISTTESVNGQMVPTKASFAAYDSPAASFDGYGKLISGPRYAGVRNGQGLDAQLDALGKSGYATDPNYAAKVGAVARGLSVPSAPQGTTTAAADMPAPNAHPVAASGLPDDITPADFDAPAPGSLRADVLAAAAQHGLSSNVSTPGMPPAGIPGATTASGVPHQLAPGAGARADSGVGAGISGEPSNAPQPSPAADPSGYLDPEGTGAANYDTGSAPSLRDTLAAAMNKGLDLGQSAPAAVPDPVSAGAPDASAPASILPPGRLPSGDVAGPAVVPDPQGTVPTAAPPAADGGLRGDLMAAVQQHDPIAAAQMQGRDVALDPVVPDPQGSMAPPAPSSANGGSQGPQSDAAAGGAGLGFGGGAASPQAALPASTPLPPPGAQSLQAPADVASAAAAPDLDPEGTGAGNYPPDGGPTLRDTLVAAMNGAPTASPAPSAKPTTGLDVGDAGLDAMRAGMVDTPPASASPAPPLPAMAQANTPSPVGQPGTGSALPGTEPLPPPGGQSMGAGASLPQSAPLLPVAPAGDGSLRGDIEAAMQPPAAPASAPQPAAGSGAALPTTGPTPPPGGQSLLAAAGPNPDAPAPNAVPAGPLPLPGSTSPMAAALAPQQFGGTGTNAVPGNSPSADPSSAQNFMRSEAARAGGGVMGSTFVSGTPTPGGFMAGIQSPIGNGQPGQVPAPAPSPMNTPLPVSAVGAGRPSEASPQSDPLQTGTGGSPPGAQQAALYALATDPRTSPQEMQMIMSRLAPAPEKVSAGEGLVVRNPDGTYRNVYSQPGKDQYAYSPDGVHILNKGTGAVTLPNGGADGASAGGWRSMSSAERQQYGVTDGRPAFIAPNREPHFGMPETQGQGETAEAKSAGEAAAARRNDMLTGAMAAPEKIARLKLLGAVLDNTQTGPLAPEIGNAAAIAQRLGISNERLVALGVDPNGPVNNAIANKLAGEMTMGSIGAKNGGMPASNFSVAERQFIEALYPNIENQAGGNRAVTDVLTAVEQRKMQVADAWASYKDQQASAGKPLSYENFEDGFRRTHSQDNIFAPIIQKYQAGGYTPTAPTPGGVPTPASNVGGQGGAPSMAQQPAPTAPQPQPQGQGSGGGGGGGVYMPGATRNVAPGVTGSPPQGQGASQAASQPGQSSGAPAPADAIAQAQAAIARGAPRAAVMQRLQSMGINTAGM